MRTGFTCDECGREVQSVWLGDREEDLCADCYQEQTGQPVFSRLAGAADTHSSDVEPMVEIPERKG